MTEIYAANIPYQRERLLNEDGNLKAEKFPKAYSPDKKIDPELLNIISQKL